MRTRTLLILALSFLLPLFVYAQNSSEVDFVPLTKIPALADAGNAAKLPDFLNSIYRLAIGIAAVLAVLQIVRAGIMFMGGDSVTERREAKSLIALSIGGLILILSPVVVFSIINPSILSLQIGGLKDLTTTEFSAYTKGASITTTDGGGASTCGSYVAIRYLEKTGGACSTLGAGYEDVVGTCTLCQPTSTQKCCGSKSVPPGSFGWKAWYKIPNTSGVSESKLMRSVKLYDTKDLCVTSATDAVKGMAPGSVYDDSPGKGTICKCGTELRLQGAECTPW